jgi:hypothetical protein
MISDDRVLYTHGKDPSHADGGVSGVVLVLSAAQALWATAEAKAMAVRQAAMLSQLAAMAGRLAAVVDGPAWLPLEVATPGTQAAQAGTPEEKPACVPAARAATGEARRWMTCESGREKAAKSVVDRSCRIEGRGDHPPHPHPATAPPRCAAFESFWEAVL